ncbi:unnamed protein product [Hymenolepis diminuta]|uniref:Uncharacterized protein n=1 Tax=Hymenolepis diminuta TaxID=6216 RepID=A0A564Y069_HYMDI|nr:unnamed protein product [Hymenolepis diminuta]
MIVIDEDTVVHHLYLMMGWHCPLLSVTMYINYAPVYFMATNGGQIGNFKSRPSIVYSVGQSRREQIPSSFMRRYAVLCVCDEQHGYNWSYRVPRSIAGSETVSLNIVVRAVRAKSSLDAFLHSNSAFTFDGADSCAKEEHHTFYLRIHMKESRCPERFPVHCHQGCAHSNQNFVLYCVGCRLDFTHICLLNSYIFHYYYYQRACLHFPTDRRSFS